jgi:hypothetical protein
MNASPGPITDSRADRQHAVAVFLLAACLFAGCESKRSDDFAAVAEPSVPDRSLASDFHFGSVPGLVAMSDGRDIIMLDLRDVPADDLPKVITEAVRLPKLAEVILGGAAADDATLAPLAQSKSIRRVKAAGSAVGDATVERLAEANRIELLDLTDVTALTPEGVAMLGRMTGLRNLKLSGSSVDDQSVQAIGNLTNLAALALQQTAVTDEGISSIRTLEKLRELSLYGTPITDASLIWLSEMPELAKLRLRGTRVTGENAGALAVLPVADLELAETDFGNAGMPAVAAMPNLQKLNLWLTKVDDEGLKHFTGKTSLVQLNLDNVSGITDRSLDVISGLITLELLHLGGTGINPEQLPKLHGLDQLKTLFVTRLGVSDAQAASLRQAMPKLTRLEY